MLDETNERGFAVPGSPLATSSDSPGRSAVRPNEEIALHQTNANMASLASCVNGKAGLLGLGRQLPTNLDAEMTVLGTLLERPGLLNKMPELSVESFTLIEHRQIFDEILGSKERGTAVDLVLIAPFVEANVSGGKDLLGTLHECATTQINAIEHARHLVELDLRRRTIGFASRIQDAAYAGWHDGYLDEAAAELADLRSLSGDASAWRSASDVTPRDINWLWEPRFVAGRVNMIVGMGNVGKDIFMCRLIASLTTRVPWPDGRPAPEPMDVGLVCPEDDPEDTIVPRLIAAGADLDRVRIWTRPGRPTPADMRGIKVLCVSPIISLMGDGKKMNDEQDVRSFLEEWSKIGVTIIATAHKNKKNDASTVERIMGSSAFANFTRSVWSIETDANDKRVRLFMRLKANLCPDEVDGLKYTIENVGPHSQSVVATFCGTTDMTPDEAAAAHRAAASKPSAVTWLVDYLRANGGQAEARVIFAAAKKEGYEEEAIRKARLRKNIRSDKEGFQGASWWILPDE